MHLLMSPIRPGRYGRRQPLHKPALRLANVLTGVVPEHPVVQNNLAALPGWQMLANDVAGNCVAVTWANFRRLMTGVLGEREVYPTQQQVWELYRTQNPNFDPAGSPYVNGPGSNVDQGMVIQTVLEHLVKNGGPDGVKPLAFARVDPDNQAEVDAAISIFGGVWTGLMVQGANEDQFAAGKPWEWVPNSVYVGGHSVLSGGYAETGPDAGIHMITWGQETRVTPGYLTQCVEEMWVVIWPELLGTKQFRQGVDVARLASDYQTLTGRPFPVDTAQPQPAPAPEPAPVVTEPAEQVVRPLSELSDSGLLWLINASVFHPRGLALSLVEQDGAVIGWQLLGDGCEPWTYPDETSAGRFQALRSTLVAHGMGNNR